VFPKVQKRIFGYLEYSDNLFFMWKWAT